MADAGSDSVVDASELRRLVDEAAIRRVLTSYSRGVDRQDAQMIASVFHPDAVAEYGAGSYTGLGPGFGEWSTNLMHNLDRRGALHHLTNSTISIDGDRAESETYLLSTWVEIGGENERQVVHTGRYIDRWERRGGEWKIVHRRFVHDASSEWPTTKRLFPPGHFIAEGEPAPHDLSCDLFHTPLP